MTAVVHPHTEFERQQRAHPRKAKKSLARFMVGVLVADIAVICLSIWTGSEVRGHWQIWGDPLIGFPSLALVHGPWILAIWLGWMGGRGGYSRKLFAAGGEEFDRVFVTSLLTAGTVAMICYLTKFDLARGFVVVTFVVGTPALLTERFLARKLLHRMRSRGNLQNRVLVVGDERATEEIDEILRRERHVGYTVVGTCLPDRVTPVEPVANERVAAAIPVLGTVSDVRQAALDAGVDTVLVAGGRFADASDVRRIGWALEGTSVDLIVVPSLTDVAGPRVHVRPVAGLPLLHIEPPQADEAVRWGKRAFDVVGSALLLMLGLPLLAAVALALKLDDGGPVFFRQRRIGLHGNAFDCLKFRSMSVDAEDLLHDLRDHNESDGPLFKIREDPRVTRVGRFLRRYSLDEMPQLINVLRGEMSLVGPRPPLPCEVEAYEESVSRRLLVRPGMTGLWQVSGRSALSWTDSVRLDLYYVDNWSLFEDIVILARTFRAVLTAEGAS